MSEDQECETFTVQRIIIIVSSRESIKFSIIKLYSKVITI